MNIRIVELIDSIKKTEKLIESYKNSDDSTKEDWIKNFEASLDKDKKDLINAIADDAVSLGLIEYKDLEKEYGVDGYYISHALPFIIDKGGLHPKKTRSNSVMYESDPLDKYIPEQFKSIHFMCLECGTPSRFYNVSQCYESECPDFKKPQFFDNAKRVGLNILRNHYEQLKAIENEEELMKHREEILNTIIHALPIYALTDKSKKPHMYRLSNGDVVLDDNLCDKLIKHYWKQCKGRDLLRPIFLKQVEVRDLFDLYSYVLNFNDDLSLTYGPNALGKTTVLNLIRCFLYPTSDDKEGLANAKFIRNTPYKCFKITFSNGEVLTITRNIDSKTKRITVAAAMPDSRQITFLNADSTYDSFYSSIRQYFPKFEHHFCFVNINRNNSFLEKEPAFAVDFRNRLIELVDDINTKFKDEIKQFCKNELKEKQKKQINVNDYFRLEKKYRDKKLFFVNSYADLDRDEKIANFIGYHLSSNDNEDPTIDFFKKFNLFKTYYESFYNEEDISKKVIDCVNGDLCLRCRSNRDDKDFLRILHFDCLSSGELNVLSIIYYLVFNNDDGAVILIDEPEISLHLLWQGKLMDSITSLMNRREESGQPPIQVIVATHSPYICSGYSDYMVEAINLENDK